MPLSAVRRRVAVIATCVLATLLVGASVVSGAQRTIEYMYLAGAEVTEQAQATIVEAFEAQNLT